MIVNTNFGAFDEQRYRRLKKVVADSEAAKLDETTFDGHPLLVRYGKYMLEYLEMEGLK